MGDLSAANEWRDERRDERQEAMRAAGIARLEELKVLLRREEVARHSEATQLQYGVAEAAGSETDWLEVTVALQERVLRESGVTADRMAAALWLLRSAAQLWPEDVELQAISCWVRHNRAVAGSLSCGDVPPNVPLHSIQYSSAATSVRCACGGTPTLLVGGSFT